MKAMNWQRVLGVILFAAFAFGGTFSDWSCHSDNVSVRQNAVTGSNKK
jgi:hypothetical protein